MTKNNIFETPKSLSNRELEYLILSADKEKITKSMRNELKKKGPNSLFEKIETEVGSYCARNDVIKTSKEYIYELYKRLCANINEQPKEKDELVSKSGKSDHEPEVKKKGKKESSHAKGAGKAKVQEPTGNAQNQEPAPSAGPAEAVEPAENENPQNSQNPQQGETPTQPASTPPPARENPKPQDKAPKSDVSTPAPVPAKPAPEKKSETLTKDMVLSELAKVDEKIESEKLSEVLSKVIALGKSGDDLIRKIFNTDWFTEVRKFDTTIKSLSDEDIINFFEQKEKYEYIEEYVAACLTHIEIKNISIKNIQKALEKGKTSAPATTPAPKSESIPKAKPQMPATGSEKYRERSLQEEKAIFEKNKSEIESVRLTFAGLGFDTQNAAAVSWWKSLFPSSMSESDIMKDSRGISNVVFGERGGEGYIRFNFGDSGILGGFRESDMGVSIGKCLDASGNFDKSLFEEGVAEGVKWIIENKEISHNDIKNAAKSLTLKDFGGEFNFSIDSSKQLLEYVNIIKEDGRDLIKFRINGQEYKIALDECADNSGKFNIGKFKDHIQKILNEMQSSRNKQFENFKELGNIRQECASLKGAKITTARMLFDDVNDEKNKARFKDTFGFDCNQMPPEELYIGKTNFISGDDASNPDIFVFDIRRSGIRGGIGYYATKDLKINIMDLTVEGADKKPHFNGDKFYETLKGLIKQAVEYHSK